jgi:flagellar biosynthesis protein FliR
MGLAATAPAWGTPGLGWRVRLGLAGILTLAIAPVVGSLVPAPSSPIALGRTCLTEACIGAALGFSMALIVAAARQAGDLVATQAGLSAASLFDPEAGESLTALGHLYGLLALGTFLAFDGPVKLVGALVESYRLVPSGGSPLTFETAEGAFGQLGRALLLSLQAAAPAALALALAGMALGLLARAAPSFQFMSLALPIRSALGVLFVLLGLVTLAGTFSHTWQAYF